MLPALRKNQYVSLDQLLDLPELINMHPEICRGIAESTPITNVFGDLLPGYPAGSIAGAISWFNSLPSTHPLKAVKPFTSSDEIIAYLQYAVETISVGSVVVLKSDSYQSGAWTESAKKFESLTEWMKRQEVFSTIERFVVFMTPQNYLVPTHSHPPDQPNREFIWVRPLQHKRFFLYNEETNEKKYVEGHSAWFNSCQYHGADPIPIATYSFRVEGAFTDGFRNAIADTGYWMSGEEERSLDLGVHDHA